MAFEARSADGTPVEGATRLRAEVVRVDVVLRADPDDPSTEEVHTVSTERRVIEVSDFVPGVVTEVARLPVPAGFVSQVRLVASDRRAAVVSFAEGDRDVALPSGERTGLKIVVRDLVEIRVGEFAGLNAVFDPATAIVGNRGVGLLLKPTLPGESTDPGLLLEAVPDELLVGFARSTAPAEMDAVHAAAGAVVLRRLRPFFHVVRFPAEMLLDGISNFYLAQPGVDFVSLNWVHRGGTTVTPIDLDPAQLLDQINAEAAWDVTTGDRHVVVAVLDTGANLIHRDLAPQLWLDETELPAACTMDVSPMDGCKDCDLDCRFAAEGRLLNGAPIVGDDIVTMRDFNLWQEEVSDAANRDALRAVAEPALAAAGIRDCWPNDPPIPGVSGDAIDGLDLMNRDPARVGCGVQDDLDNDGVGFPDAVFGWSFVPEITIPIENSPATGSWAGYGPADFDIPWDDNNTAYGARTNVLHGTGMAGIIGAAAGNSIFVPSAVPCCRGATIGLAGVAWEVRLMPVKVCGPLNNCGNYVDWMLAIDFAANRGANVINMSFGSMAALSSVIPPEGDPNFRAACSVALDEDGPELRAVSDVEQLRKWAAQRASCWHAMGFDALDVTFVAAANNCPMSIGNVTVFGDRLGDVSIDGAAITWPASLDASNMLAVAGAVGGSVVAGASAFGPAVEVAGPTGVRSLSTGIEGTATVGLGSSEPTAVASGVAVLVRAACPSRPLTAAEVVGAIVAGATPGVVPDTEVAGGRFLDALGAVQAAQALPGCP